MNLHADVVLDPTLLITKQEWENFSNKENSDDDAYILLYLIQNRKKTLQYARNYAKKHNLKIKYINISPYLELGMENIKTASPEEFISLIMNASIVLTGSYHGVVLALNLNKPLLIQTNSARINFNSRINTIVENFGLQELILDFDYLNIPEFDYEKFNKQLETERNFSLLKLKESLLK